MAQAGPRFPAALQSAMPIPVSVPCAKCGRPMAEQAKRCLYCGTYRITAAPGTPEFEAEKKAAEEDAKRVERQKVIYSHGMGLGKSANRLSLAERLRHESLPVRLVAGLLAIPMLAIWPPWAIKWVKGLFLT
jgi:hypothetical protein